VDGANRPGKSAIVLPQLVSDEHLVEVHVAVDECRKQQLARAVGDSLETSPGARADAGDALTVDYHIGDVPVEHADTLQRPHGRLR